MAEPVEEEWSRARLRKEGFVSLVKSSALHKYGYQIVIWLSARRAKAKIEPSVVYEYVPKLAGAGDRLKAAAAGGATGVVGGVGRELAAAPVPTTGRFTAATLNGQIAAHRAIGAPVRHQGAFSFLFE